jgi:hypothetical protein
MPYIFITQPVIIERKDQIDEVINVETRTNIRLVHRRPQGIYAKSTDVVLREGVALDHNGVIDFKRQAKAAFGLK